MTPQNTIVFIFLVSFTWCVFSSNNLTPQQLAEQQRKITVDDFKQVQQQIIVRNDFLRNNLQRQLACAYHSNNQLQYDNHQALEQIYQLKQENAQLHQAQELHESHMQTFRKLIDDKNLQATTLKTELQTYKNEKLNRQLADQARKQLATTKNIYEILPAANLTAVTSALTTQKIASFKKNPPIDKAAKQKRKNQEKQILNFLDCLIDELLAQQASDIAETAIDDQRACKILELQAASAQELACIATLEQQLIKDQQLVAQKLTALQHAVQQTTEDETLSAIMAHASAPELSATDSSKKSHKKKNKKNRTTVQTVEKEDETKNNQDLQDILETLKIKQELRSLHDANQKSHNAALEQACSNIAHHIERNEKQEEQQQKKERETQAILATLRAQARAPQQPFNISDDHIKEDWSVLYNAMFQLYQYTNWEIYQQQRLKDIESEKASNFDAQDDALEAWLEDKPEIKITYMALSDYQHALKFQDIPAIEQAITRLQQLDPLGIQRLLVMFDHIYHSIQKSTEQLEDAHDITNESARTIGERYKKNKDSVNLRTEYLQTLNKSKSQKTVLDTIKAVHAQQEIADVELMIHYDAIDLNSAGKLSDATLIRAETDMQNILAQNSPMSFAQATGIVRKLLQAADCATKNIPLYQAIEQFCNASATHITIPYPKLADYAAAALYIHLQKRNGDDISLHDQIADQAKIYKHFILAHQKALRQIKTSQAIKL